MNTSDPSGGSNPPNGFDELARVAAEMFRQLPGGLPGAGSNLPTGAPAGITDLRLPTPPSPVLLQAAAPAPLPPPGLGPAAASVGAGGVSTSQAAPPTPGFLQQPPLASAPPPRESDLRNVLVSGPASVGAPSSLLLPQLPAAPSGVPYFMEIAGPPAGFPRPEAHGQSVPESAALPSGLDAGRGFVFSPKLGPLGHEHAVEAVPNLPAGSRIFDPHAVKRDFPILDQRVNGRPLVWLDNAATTQKPQAVIDRLSRFYQHENSNVHRGAHTLAARATDAYEGARDKVRGLLNAPAPQNIVFTRGATEAINLVAQSWGRRNVRAGDEIVITWLEHHANIVPWQQLCAETGARLRVAPVDDRGQVRLDEYEKLLGPKTRMVSVTQVSNALGTIVPVQEMTAMAHRHGAKVLVDGAQAVSHMRVDVQAIDCDFYCFSGHKVFAPTGIGALFGRADVLDAMPPWHGGGNMIADVTFEQTSYQKPPWRFEAGTGNIADAAGLGAAIDYLQTLGLENVSRHEHALLEYGTHELRRVPGLRMIGTAPEKAGVLSFVIDGLPTEEMGGLLDKHGIAVRSGHHCAQPILRRFGVEHTVRASLAPYNTSEDIDALVTALLRIQAESPRRGSHRGN
jgi:cysteine desulfurase/selenocysteine lyase